MSCTTDHMEPRCGRRWCSRLWRVVRRSAGAVFYCLFAAPAQDQLWAQFVPLERAGGGKAEVELVVDPVVRRSTKHDASVN